MMFRKLINYSRVQNIGMESFEIENKRETYFYLEPHQNMYRDYKKVLYVP